MAGHAILDILHICLSCFTQIAHNLLFLTWTFWHLSGDDHFCISKKSFVIFVFFFHFGVLYIGLCLCKFPYKFSIYLTNFILRCKNEFNPENPYVFHLPFREQIWFTFSSVSNVIFWWAPPGSIQRKSTQPTKDQIDQHTKCTDERTDFWLTCCCIQKPKRNWTFRIPIRPRRRFENAQEDLSTSQLHTNT